MLIKYKPKYDHVKCIPLIPDPKDPKSYNRNQIQLLPGTNEITDDEWEAIKPHIATEIKAGEITTLTVKARSNRRTPDGKARSLKDVPASVARDIIEKCVNPSTLKKWFGEETRDEVLLIVTKRMRKLKLDPDEIEKENGEADGDTLDEENSHDDTGEVETGAGTGDGDEENGDEGDDPDPEETGEGEGDPDPEDEDDHDEFGNEIPDFDAGN
jgi:hypothetical protein